jgi:hypothetical protein
MSLGHKKASPEEVEAIVERLYVVKKKDEAMIPSKSPQMSREEIAQMVERLADKERNLEKTPERNRTGADRQMGVVNTYAWTNGTNMRDHSHAGDGNFY